MKLEVGKFYKTRDGRKVGPIIGLPDGEFCDGGRVWLDVKWSRLGDVIGKSGFIDVYDLIAEWQDEPEAYSEIIEKVNIAESAFKAMADQAEEDGRKVFIAEMERALQDDLRRSTRAHILDTVKQYVTNDRQNTHGKPEDTFGLIAELWGAYLGRAIAPVEVCAMMALLKIARSADNPQNADNWIDLAGYAACAGELAK